jgi:ribose-phosphate pyrophosphokinase
MPLLVLGGTANVPLAEAVARHLGAPLGRRTLELFPDGEQRVELYDSVRGRDTYIIQPTSPPVAQHLMELLLLADACRRAGAARLTAVVTYMGYGRQDRRARGREPIAARLAADLIRVGGFERLVAVDLHSPALEGLLGIPVEHLSAVPLLASALKTGIPERSIVVAPDVGAVKLAERYADLLDLPVAVVHKLRVSGTEVTVRRVVGEVAERAPLVVDDMITTGATVEAAVHAVVREGARPEVTVAATHGLFVGGAGDRLDALGIRRLVVSDSVAVGEHPPAGCEVRSVAPLLAEAVLRLHREESLADLIVHQ